MVQEFTKNEVEPQALQYNREERFNRALFERAGELGLLGVTVDPEYGGAGMDATAACIVHEELSYSDPAFCLSYWRTRSSSSTTSRATAAPRSSSSGCRGPARVSTSAGWA